MPQESTLLPEATVLLILRIFLFLGCRQYLLRNLYSDLKALSSGSVGAAGDQTLSSTPTLGDARATTTGSDHEIEMEPLPAPAMHRPNKTLLNADTLAFHSSSIARTVFSLVFVESCMMFFVLMLQGTGRFTPRIRYASWNSSLFSLMGTILLVVPVLISLLLAAGGRSSAPRKSLRRRLVPRLALSFLLILISLSLFAKIPLPPALKTSDLFTATLARLVVLGTIILGVLSGFGAVSNAWDYLPFVKRSEGVPSDQEISRAESSLQNIRNDLSERRETIQRRRSVSSTESTWMARFVPSFRGGANNSDELRGLELLEHQMTLDLESLRSRRDATRYARTFRGKLMGVTGRIFAVYCLLRIGSSIINLLFPSRYASKPSSQDSPTMIESTADLVADVLLKILEPFLSYFGVNINLDAQKMVSFARQLSLVMVGVIILTSIRRVLVGVTRALRITSRSTGASFMMLFLAQLMGIYLLSTIVQLRNSFPPPASATNPDESLKSGESNLFHTVPEFQVFGSLFDWSFLIAAGGGAAVQWGKRVAA